MAISTPAILCPAGEWTLVADGKASVALQWREEMVYGKWTAAASAPDIGTNDYWTLRPKAPACLNDLPAGTKIWAMPAGGVDLTLEVVEP
jgi:hypothetical protein